MDKARRARQCQAPAAAARASGRDQGEIAMSLAVAIQMDPIERIDIDADSTFVLALEAQRRGHGLYHYLPTDLSYDHGRVKALARPLQVRRERGNHYTLGAAEMLDLRTFDIVLMRQDPPFDLNYVAATHLLERLASGHARRQRPGLGAQRAREAVRHAVRRAHAADPDHLPPRRDQGVPRRAQGHHREADLRQRRRRRVPHPSRRREPEQPARPVRRRRCASRSWSSATSRRSSRATSGSC